MANGALRLPSEWLTELSGKIYYLYDESAARGALLPECEFAKCGKSMRKNAVALKIDDGGSVSLGQSISGVAEPGVSVLLMGCVRYIAVLTETPKGK